jgi:hypothetical protein
MGEGTAGNKRRLDIYNFVSGFRRGLVVFIS